MPKKALNSDWYSKYYSQVLKQDCPYLGDIAQNPYIKIWLSAIALIGKKEKIIDLGCGPGQFAELCLSSSLHYIKGIDFSEVAINMAKIRNSSVPDRFEVGDLRNAELYSNTDYDVAVLFEVLEHVDNDIFIIKNIPAGKHVIFSVPSAGGISHVRHFSTPDEAIRRYSPYLTYISSQPVLKHFMSRKSQIYLFNAIKK